ncbi:MAG TPA: decaprenyl-phosphate phosphoribosyltransferase [Xanthomonadales bacterium]|nr:decaprenyl-phosphate phosphoribosyltransferase [Xanthomonadales bacterium]
MKKIFRDELRLLRPRQWIKNFAIFAALIFSGDLFFLPTVYKTINGFLIFCAMSSAIYVINDIFDREKDRLHPFKKYRPLANNDISIKTAYFIAIVLILISLTSSYFVSTGFFLITLIFLLLHVAYSAFLKHIEIIDILTLAGGYILRVFAGEVVTGYHISAWLLLTTIALALFLAIGKRRSELTLLGKESLEKISITRKTLSHYTEKLLDVYLSVFATAAFIFYSLFTFLENPQGSQVPINSVPADILGTYLQKKWLMITIIPVVYGIMRYLQRIYEKHEGESPERVLFSDRALLTSVVIWGLLVVFIIYYIRA